MGEISEAMVTGECCSLCGQYFQDKNGEIFIHGFPVACNDCWDTDCGYEKQSKKAEVL